MKRRTFLAALLPVAASGAQSFSSNPPQCPICHTPVPAASPELLPVVGDTSGGISTITHLRDLFCGNCGARFVATK